jgi:type 1 glutamine amidotransferase
MRSSFRFWLVFAVMLSAAVAADKQILLLAGKPSHPPGEHEHNAGVLLIAKWLNTVPGIHATTSLNDAWPPDSAFDKADAVFIFVDGGEGHPSFQDNHAEVLSKAAKRGAGLMFFHFATEPPKERGHQEMLDWIGGFFEVYHSVNPVYEGVFSTLPSHPITRGVKPFRIRDEWYYNIRFRENPQGFTPILVTIPPADTVHEDGPYSGNPDVRSKIGQPQTVAWAMERADGGRGAGMTGGHFHANLGDENFRKVVLNSILWIAKAEVPPNGVQVSPGPNDLTENLDPKPKK